MTAAPGSPRNAVTKLSLEIGATRYSVRAVVPDRSIADRAFRLLKDDGTIYDVSRTPHGLECDCPDFVFRRDGLDPAGCKHVRALVNLGLIVN